MDYIIKTLSMLRYDTCGDYFVNDDGLTELNIKSQTNQDYEFLITIHELIEEYLTRKRNIKEEDIMIFDLMFEQERRNGLHSEDDEPGYDIRSPYRREHIFSENIERLIAQELGVDWVQYNNEIIS